MRNKIKKILSISILLFTVIIFLFVLLSRNIYQVNFIARNLPTFFSLYFGDTYDLPIREIDVISYNIDIKIFSKEKSIEENAQLKIVNLKNDTKEIELDLYDGFTINYVKVNSVESTFDYSENKIKIFSDNYFPDTLNLEIDFSGEPLNLGFGSFWIEAKNNKNFVATLNEPIFASTWFPCNDKPNDKAMVQMSITNDSNIVSLSNGKLVDIITTDDRRTYTWKSEYPVATYLISIYSGEYKTFSQQYVSANHTMNIDYYVMEEKLADANFDFENHPNYLKVFSELFGEYPFIKEKYGVAEILWQQGAMESQTITGIGGNFISGKNFNEAILIHEVAHHWWGNAVTPKTWNDIWLNEGFAKYSEALYFEKIFGNKALISSMNSFMSRIDSKDTQKLNPPGVNIFSSTIYNKGAWVLHMLRKEIGDSLFFSGIRKYYNDFKYGNVNTEDMKHTFEAVSDNNLDGFFKQWVYEGEGFIELEINMNEHFIKSDSIVIEIDIKQIQTGYKNYTFPIDIEIEDSSGLLTINTPYISSDTTLTFIIQSRVKNIFFDKNNWLLADITYNKTN